MSVQHCLAFVFVRAGQKVNWFIGLRHWKGSSCLFYPASMKHSGPFSWLELQPASKPPLILLLDLSPAKLKVAKYEWRRWLWQIANVKDQSTVPSVRPFVSGEVGSFMEVACENAWFDMNHSQVSKFAAHLQKDFQPCHTFFQLLWEVVKRELKCSDEKCLRILQARVINTMPTDTSEALLQLDEAMEVIEDHDVKMINAQQVLIKDQMEHHDLFAIAYTAKSLQVKIASKKRARTADQPQDFPHHIQQKDVKTHSTLGASLWSGKSPPQWAGHLKPFRRVSASFSKWGLKGHCMVASSCFVSSVCL